jgi:predicted short-subunit dehydrogenase-like oxidoreductase (DUF2520 family)
MSLRIVFIGAGNLATRLSLEFKRSGFYLDQIYSRTDSSAGNLAKKLQSNYTTNTKEISTDADIYFVALKDSAVHKVLPDIQFGNKLVVHCSGSLPLSALQKYSENTGVFYPLQTFSKEQPVDFRKIPVFIEANSEENEKKLLQIARKISDYVTPMDSDRRLSLHISAVFACNFVNHCYTVAGKILEAENIPFEALHPLILETAMKVQKMKPERSQTGPAVRFDENIISAHLEKLAEYPEIRELYKIMSLSINNYHKTR